MSNSTNNDNKDDFEKASKLGEAKSIFPIWEKEIKGILEHYHMDDYEKIRVIMVTISDKYYDTCNNLLYTNDITDPKEFIKKIKHQLRYDKTSLNNINKLESMKIKNNNVRDYTMNFNIYASGISEEDKPSEKRMIHLFVRGLQGSRYYDIMSFRSFESLDKAIEEVNKLADSYEEYEIYESKNKPPSNNFQRSKFNKFNKRKDSFLKKDTYDKRDLNSMKDSNNKKDINSNEKQIESDIDNITNQFAQMKLYVCNRCNKKGHIAKYCTNEIAPENLKIIQQNNAHLNY